ncbi:CPBP family intramembrane metalloprotease, partial [Eubacteriales bacterium OttesenSCG-928-K08]|nr:CPBP family intramembrane metalloprotease [Eubacteriales bacterium OttesenSCG-928-K08]
AKQIFTLLIALFGMMYVLNIGTTFILSFISAGISFISGKGFDFGSVNPVSEILLNSNPGYLIAIAVLIGPMIEEIMFRKLLLPILEPFGGKAYIFMSAFLFSLFHGNLNQIPYAFVVGVVLGAVYWFTHDLRYTILLHIMLNFLGSGVSVLLLNFAPELAWVWTVAILVLMVAGIVIAARWWIRHKKELVFLPGAVYASRQDMLVNPGMISYMVLTGLIVIFTFFAY